MVYNMFEKAIEAIKSADKIAIYTHKNPDGDAIGCAYALKLALLSFGKLADVYLEYENSVKLFPFTKGVELCRISNAELLLERDCDLRVSVDCADKKRLGVKLKNFTGNTLAIDHHISHSEFASVTLLDGNSPSCGEIVYKLICELGVDITSDIADNLYMAIVSDTGGFKYPAVTSETLKIAADLIEKGANFTEITRSIFDIHTPEFLKLTKIAIDKIKLYFDGKVAVMLLDGKDFKKAGLSEQAADKIVDLPRNIAGVDVSLYVRQRKGTDTKISLRSNCDVDVAQIAQKFGGGGHIRAAGFETRKKIETVVREVLEMLRGELS